MVRSPSFPLPSPLCFPCLPFTSSLKGGPGIPGVSAFPAGCRFGPLLPGLHGPKPGLRHALCSLHERGGCYRCGGDVPAAPSSRCFRHRDTGVPNAELLSHRCPFPFPFPFCSRSHCRQKAEAQTRHVHSGTRGGSQLCSSLLGHLFLFIVFKKGKKKGKKVSPSPLPSPLPPSYLPEPNFSKICILIGRSPLSSSPFCLAAEGRVCLVDRRGAMSPAGQGKGCWRQNGRNERDRDPSWKRLYR